MLIASGKLMQKSDSSHRVGKEAVASGKPIVAATGDAVSFSLMNRVQERSGQVKGLKDLRGLPHVPEGAVSFNL